MHFPKPERRIRLSEDFWPVLNDYPEIFNPDLQRREYAGRTWVRRYTQPMGRKNRRITKANLYSANLWFAEFQTPTGFTRRGDELAKELLSHPFFSELLNRNLR